MIDRIGENWSKMKEEHLHEPSQNVRQSTQMQQAWNEREANCQPWYAFFKNHHSPVSMSLTVRSRLEEDGRFCTVHFHRQVDIRSEKDVCFHRVLTYVMWWNSKLIMIIFFTSGSNHDEPSVKNRLSFHYWSVVCTNRLWYTFSRLSQASTRLTHFRISSENASRGRRVGGGTKGKS